jgi:hypothetical protein
MIPGNIMSDARKFPGDFGIPKFFNKAYPEVRQGGLAQFYFGTYNAMKRGPVKLS